MDTAIKSKLQALLRLGLVSQNNVRRAMTLFSDPEKYSRSPAYRTLMQEILVDVVDTILKNRVLYTALRSSLTKTKGAADASETIAATSQKLGESAESDRTTALLRSGLVDKSQITAARKALKSKSNLKSMSTGKVYREMMINMLDSLVKKITGSPSLFNAFKYTMGKEVVEEDFDWACEESIAIVGLHEDAQEILEANKPTNPSLWSQAKAAAKSKFKVYPSAYANGWAVKWYNSKGGGWKSVSEGKTFFDFMTDLQELSKKTRDAYVAKRGSQLQRMTTGLDHYRNLLTGKQQANAVKGIKRATGVKEAVESGQLTPEEQEIYLTAVNTESIYRSRITPIIKNYQRKLGKGKYNPELAIKGFVYAVEDAIKEYAKHGAMVS